MIPNNDYNLISDESLAKFLQNNKIEIPFVKKGVNIFFFIFMIISTIFIVIPLPLISFIILLSLLIIEILLLLYFESRKIVLIKDESENKIKIQVINYLFTKRKKFEIDLENINFSVIHYNQKYILLILNNQKNWKENDFYTIRYRDFL